MLRIIYAVVAACIIYSFWQLTLYLLKKFRTATECASCDGKGWYQGVRERERCEVCGGTGEKQ